MGVAKEYWDKLKEIAKLHPKGRPYKLDKDGREIGFMPDPTPVAPPLGQANVADIDMFEVMRNRIRNEISISAQMDGAESFEEADDFYVEEDYEPFSPWEVILEQANPASPIHNPDPDQPPPLGRHPAEPQPKPEASKKPPEPPEGA